MLLVFKCFMLKAQEIKSNTIFYYKFEFQRDSTDITRKFDETMVLISNGSESLYKSYVKMQHDSIIQDNFSKGNYSIDFSKMPKSRVNHEVYYSDKNIEIFDKVVNKFYNFPVEEINWHIVNEKKKIGEFNCQKAICEIDNRKYIAWFTTDIPVNDGPYRFKGLPGLVVEVYDQKKYFSFNLIGIKKQNLKISVQKNSIKTTFLSFIKERNDFYADPAGKVKMYMSGNVQFADPKVINDKFKKDNLFIY